MNFKVTTSPCIKPSTSFFRRGLTKCEQIEQASQSILSEGKGTISRGKSLYNKLIKKFHGNVEYKTPDFEASEREIEIINKIAGKHHLPTKTKKTLIGLLTEDGKIMGNETLLDRFTPRVVSVPLGESSKYETISNAFDSSLYNLLGTRPKCGPNWTWSPVIGSLRDEAINLTGTKGIMTSAELIGKLIANNAIS